MPQTALLVDQLKKSLQEAGITYAVVANQLGLSEGSVKRLFAQKKLTLTRLDAICSLMDMEISDLTKSIDQSAVTITELTEEQEREIVSNTDLLLVMWCLINHWSITQIRDVYELSKPECTKLLVRLDRLKLIELLPNDRVKLLVGPTFNWRTDGPILRFFHERIESEFFTSKFSEPTEKLICINGMMSDNANFDIQSRMQRLAQQFDEACAEDAERLPFTSRKGTTLVTAIRRWEYSSFTRLKRKKSAPSVGTQ